AQGAAVTSASGFATIILNGPNTKGRISTTFSGLSTPQLTIDGSHVHYANTGTGPVADKTVIYGDPDGLPVGLLSDYPWTIVDSAGLKGGQIIDAMFRKNTGENIYVNVHTDRYALGEIRADLTLQTGSQTPPPTPTTPTLENLATDELVKRDCARFLTQATFGPTEAEITALYNTIAAPKTTAANRLAAYTAWLNTQWGLDQTSIYDYNIAADAQEWARWGLQPDLPAVVDNPATTTVNETYPAAPPPSSALDWTRWGAVPNPSTAWTYRPIPPGLNKESYDMDNNNRRRAWWTAAIRGHDQLRLRTGAALEQIFIISDREGTVGSRHYAHARYMDMLADSADGPSQKSEGRLYRYQCQWHPRSR
ncbi:MAG: CHRD domain-containing protein, partial [Verrucomicrobia bacterium]|nr:CHRD domain-containing protein [Verrucomicrobiota bacterium]